MGDEGADAAGHEKLGKLGERDMSDGVGLAETLGEEYAYDGEAEQADDTIDSGVHGVWEEGEGFDERGEEHKNGTQYHKIEGAEGWRRGGG